MAKAFETLKSLDQQIYSLCLGLLSAIGFVGNVLLAVTSFVKGLESTFTTYLVRSQALIDAVVCFITIWLLIFPNTVHTGNYIVDILVCHIWTGQALFWWVVLSSVYNLVFTAVDRYWAVLTPQKYKQNLNKKLILAYSIIFGLCGVITLPSFWQSRFSNGSCTADLEISDPFMQDFFTVYSVLWFLAIYGFPAPIMIYIYAKVLLKLRNSMDSDSGSNRKSAFKAFTMCTCVTTGIFLVTIPYDAIYYMFGYVGIAVYIFNTPIQLVGVFLTAVNSSISPIAFFVLVKSFRRTFVLIWCKCAIWRMNQRVSDTQMTHTTVE